MSISTRRGDEGETDLLYGGRVPKYHIRVEAYGAVHEANAALGLARALLSDKKLRGNTLKIQEELFLIGSELATDTSQIHRLPERIGKAQVEWLDAQLAQAEKASPVTDWVIPGNGTASSAFHLASTIIRRAERWVVRLQDDNLLDNPELIIYLNRLADLIFMLAKLSEES